ncbi:MAG: PmoA family protein [Candidatus Brocadiia bacterium]
MSEYEITLQMSERGASFTPASVELDMPADAAGIMGMKDPLGKNIPFQIEKRGKGCRLHWIVESAASGQELTYSLEPKGEEFPDDKVQMVQEKGKIEIRIGDQHFTTFHYGSEVPRPVLYPIIGPYGDGVTRHYPMEIIEDDHTDHPHHRSVWVAWGDVNGSDNWSEGEESGRLETEEVVRCEEGPVYGLIHARNAWVDVNGKKLMEDETRYRFYNLPGDMRLIQINLELHATEGDIRLGDTKEGGLCSVRVAAPMEVDRGGQIQNSFGGVDEPETWGKRAHWCDYNGMVNGYRVGIAIFDDPGNFRHPTYWHVRNYGLMTANPFGLSYFRAPLEVDGSHTIPAGESMSFRYAVYVHAGDASEGNVGDRYLDWVYPPAASLPE